MRCAGSRTSAVDDWRSAVDAHRTHATTFKTVKNFSMSQYKMHAHSATKLGVPSYDVQSYK